MSTTRHKRHTPKRKLPLRKPARKKIKQSPAAEQKAALSRLIGTLKYDKQFDPKELDRDLATISPKTKK